MKTAKTAEQKQADRKAARPTVTRFVGANGTKLLVAMKHRTDGTLTHVEEVKAKGEKAVKGMYALHATKAEGEKAYAAICKSAEENGWTLAPKTGFGGKVIPESAFTSLPKAPAARKTGVSHPAPEASGASVTVNVGRSKPVAVAAR